MVGQAISEAARACDFPEGTFSLLFDSEYAVGHMLVAQPRIKAVGFIGSRNAGRTLLHAVNARAEPIPFFGEMSSINPVIFLPSAFEQEFEKRARALALSLTNGAGQFCTKPGVVFVPLDRAKQLASRLSALLEIRTPSPC